MTDSTFSLAHAPFAVDLVVRFAETDAMGVVHHGVHVLWFECGRVAWMDAAQMPYAEVAAGGNHFAVTNLQVAYRASARFGDTVRVITWLTKLRSRQVEFQYEVRNAFDQTLLATGSSEHICVDLAGRMAKIPAPILERLQQGALRLATEQKVHGKL